MPVKYMDVYTLNKEVQGSEIKFVRMQRSHSHYNVSLVKICLIYIVCEIVCGRSTDPGHSPACGVIFWQSSHSCTLRDFELVIERVIKIVSQSM